MVAEQRRGHATGRNVVAVNQAGTDEQSEADGEDGTADHESESLDQRLRPRQFELRQVFRRQPAVSQLIEVFSRVNKRELFPCGGLGFGEH